MKREGARVARMERKEAAPLGQVSVQRNKKQRRRRRWAEEHGWCKKKTKKKKHGSHLRWCCAEQPRKASEEWESRGTELRFYYKRSIKRKELHTAQTVHT